MNASQLASKYSEGLWYTTDSFGRVLTPNVVINGEQQTYVHFEDARVFAFKPDRLTIQARGQADGSILSGEIVSRYNSRSFCVEAKYKIPSSDKSWPAFWQYANNGQTDGSEIDVEQPITQWQGVNHVTMLNHGPETTNVVIGDAGFTTPYMTYYDASFDASTAPHTYTTCYDDAGAGKLTRYVDGKTMYTATFKWNASMGGTGFGGNAHTLLNLAVGGVWPGNHPNPSTYSGDLDIYSVDYYAP